MFFSLFSRNVSGCWYFCIFVLFVSAQFFRETHFFFFICSNCTYLVVVSRYASFSWYASFAWYANELLTARCSRVWVVLVSSSEPLLGRLVVDGWLFVVGGWWLAMFGSMTIKALSALETVERVWTSWLYVYRSHARKAGKRCCSEYAFQTIVSTRCFPVGGPVCMHGSIY